MGKKRKKSRVRSKIDELPEDIKNKVDELLADTSYTYLDISEWIKEQDYDVSKSAVGRYALRTNNATKRLMEAQQQAKALINVVKNNPEEDYTEATMQMLMAGLTEKIATAQEEFDSMPLDKAGRLVVALSRTKVYKDKLKIEFDKGAKEALNRLKAELKKELEDNPGLLQQLSNLADKVAKRMEVENAR